MARTIGTRTAPAKPPPEETPAPAVVAVNPVKPLVTRLRAVLGQIQRVGRFEHQYFAELQAIADDLGKLG